MMRKYTFSYLEFFINIIIIDKSYYIDFDTVEKIRISIEHTSNLKRKSVSQESARTEFSFGKSIKKYH